MALAINSLQSRHWMCCCYKRDNTLQSSHQRVKQSNRPDLLQRHARIPWNGHKTVRFCINLQSDDEDNLFMKHENTWQSGEKKIVGAAEAFFSQKIFGILILSVVYQNVKIFEKWPFILEKTSTRYHRTFGVSLWACLKNAYQEAAFSIFTSQKAWKTIDGWQLPIFGMHCT